MFGRFRKPLLAAVTLLTAVALGGCIIEPYPRYAYYGPGYYHPHYWWR